MRLGLMPNRIVIEYDGTRVEIDQPMTEAAARVWLFDQAIRLTRGKPLVSEHALLGLTSAPPQHET